MKRGNGTMVSPKRFTTSVIAAALIGIWGGYMLGNYGTKTREQFRQWGLNNEKAKYEFSEYTGKPRFAWKDDRMRDAELAVFGSVWEYR